jgi:hypothetical protein
LATIAETLGHARREAGGWVVAEEVTLERVGTGLVHRSTGEHVRDPSVVIGVIADDLAQRGDVVAAASLEARGHRHVPLVRADARDHALECVVGQHEGLGLGHAHLLVGRLDPGLILPIAPDSQPVVVLLRSYTVWPPMVVDV